MQSHTHTHILTTQKEEMEREMLKKQEEELMKSLKEAVSSGNLERQTQPAMILESKEVPELPEMKINEMVSSPFTREDAIRYLTKLALYQHGKKSLQNTSSGTRNNQTVKKRNKLEDITANNGTHHESTEEEQGGHQLEDTNKPNIKTIPIISTAKDDDTASNKLYDQAIRTRSTDTQAKQDKVSTTDSKDSKDRKDSIQLEKTAEKSNSDLDDLDPELMKILNEAAEAIKKNQTPVTRQFPTKVRKTPQQIKEEEIRRRFPGKQPWPTLEECQEKPLPKTLVFTSTWLSVTAKGVK